MVEAHDLYRIVHLFSPESPAVWQPSDELHTFEGMPPREIYFAKDGQPDYDALFAFYAPNGLKPSDFREKTANLTNPEVLEDYTGQPLMVDWITTPDELMARKGGYFTQNPFFQIAAIGVTVTSDNQVVVGVRGGAVTPERVQMFASGLYGCAPGGGVIFDAAMLRARDNLLGSTIYHEFMEEIGEYPILHNSLMGVVEAFKPGPHGYKWIHHVTTSAPLNELQDTNRQANEIWRKHNPDGKNRWKAQDALKEKGLPIDAWEHYPLVGIPNDPEGIEHIVNAQPQSFASIGAAALMTYAAWAKR